MALWEKIMLLLDELFQLIEDCTPVVPRWTEEDIDTISEPGTPKNPLQKLNMMKEDIYTQEIPDIHTVQDVDNIYD